jgi:molybdenum-dependent DNA-binding transcriptional regulator ModE
MKQVELQGRIDKATREISNSYGKALKAVEELKRKIGELELSISSKGRAKTSEDMNQLNSALDSLDRLTDSLILESRRAWEEYGGLERDCRTTTCEPIELKGLRDLCGKTEQFAADLLCYSLARFKRKDGLDDLSK